MMFWIFVAVLIVVALAIVIIPLLRVDEITEISREDQNIVIAKDKLESLKEQLENNDFTEEQFDIAKADLENALALDLESQKAKELHDGGKWLIYLLLILLPLSSAGLYYKLGKPDLLDPKAKLAEMKQANQNLENMSVSQILDLVKKRLKDNPEDGDGWYILGRTFMNVEKYPEAVTAYQRSYDLVGEDANIMLSLADAIAMTNDGLMQGEPEKLVQKAIEIEPNNQIGLWLGGLAAEQRNDIPQAYGLWNRLLPLLKADPESYNEIKTMLTHLKITFPDLPALQVDKVEVAVDDVVAGIIAQVNLSISISPAIRSTLSGNEEVFVYAKAVTGPPMPLAAKKLKVSDLPITVTLSDADAMMPQLKLSSVDAFTVGARVSMSGNPIPQKGDYFMEVSPLSMGSLNGVVELIIEKIVD